MSSAPATTGGGGDKNVGRPLKYVGAAYAQSRTRKPLRGGQEQTNNRDPYLYRVMSVPKTCQNLTKSIHGLPKTIPKRDKNTCFQPYQYGGPLDLWAKLVSRCPSIAQKVFSQSLCNSNMYLSIFSNHPTGSLARGARRATRIPRPTIRQEVVVRSASGPCHGQPPLLSAVAAAASDISGDAKRRRPVSWTTPFAGGDSGGSNGCSGGAKSQQPMSWTTPLLAAVAAVAVTTVGAPRASGPSPLLAVVALVKEVGASSTSNPCHDNPVCWRKCW